MATVELTEKNFEDIVTKNDMVVIDFWATWCGPCRSFAPVFETASEANPEVVFAKVNTEEEQGLAGHFNVRSIPTLMIFRENVIIFSQAGALPKEALEDVIKKAQSLDMEVVHAEIAKQATDTESEAK